MFAKCCLFVDLKRTQTKHTTQERVANFKAKRNRFCLRKGRFRSCHQFQFQFTFCWAFQTSIESTRGFTLKRCTKEGYKCDRERLTKKRNSSI